MAAGEADLEAKSRHRDALVVGAAKVGALALVAYGGFTALSDDDYARIVISQRFAATPAWDPTGTTWLPLPFWLDGTLMAVFGTSVGVARASTAILGVVSALLVLVAARLVGVPRYGAVVGALVACVIPYAVWLGLATVPDGWTAALVLVGAASSASHRTRHRAIGASALLAATLCRYEAWPAAAAFAAVCAWDAVRTRRTALAGAAVGALAGGVGWSLHGAAHHDGPWFFLSRVAEYRRAVGGASSPAATDALWYPLAFLRAEPELAGFLLVALAWAARAGVGAELRAHARPALVIGSMVVTLSISAALGGAPTHHNERTLLAAWLLAAVVAGHAVFAVWRTSARRGQLLFAGALVTVVVLGATVLRPWYARRDAFVDRRAEIAIGSRARELASDADRLLVDTADFGFHAVMAGFGHPSRATALDERDPRRPARDDPFRSEEALRARAADARAALLVARAEHASMAARLGPVEARNDRFVLVRIRPDARGR